MNKLQLKIIGMSYSQSQSGAYALILGEVEGERRLPIIIGGFEAQAIAIELEKMKPTRPLTHDLFRNFARTFGVEIREVVINKFHEGVFYAKLVSWDGKREVEIDSRTSDAVAIALRFNCPIYTYENILSEAGIIMDDDSPGIRGSKAETTTKDAEYSTYSIGELEELLSKAVEKEEYERASQIRDEINRRADQTPKK